MHFPNQGLHMIEKIIYKLYSVPNSRLRSILMRLLCRLEGGEMNSKTLRKVFKDYHDVEVGMYSAGCFEQFQLYGGTTVGRYCSITPTAKTITYYHPMHFKSTNALFYYPEYGNCSELLVQPERLTIGNDVWIGEYAVILPSASKIGDGAVIGAGAVVNKDIPPYAIVVGNPARVVGYRFSKEIIDDLLASRWWENDIDDLKPMLEEFQAPYEQYYSSRKNSVPTI
jgi:virginiamycin A acetyltransferase